MTVKSGSAALTKILRTALRAVTLDGQVRVVFRAPSTLTLLDLSRSGKVLLARASPRRESHVLLRDGADRDLTWLFWSFPMALSADGKQLLFVEQSGVSLYESCIRDTAGSPPVHLGAGVGFGFSPGEDYVFMIPGYPIDKISMMPVKLGAEQPIRLDDFQCSWFACLDANTLLATGSRNDEPPSLYTLGVGRPPQRINIKGPDIPTLWIPNALSPDRKSMAGWDSHRKLRIYSLEKDESRAVPGAARGEVSILWGGDGSKLYTYAPGRMSAAVYCTDLNSGEKTPWKDIRPSMATGVHGLGPLLISPDLQTCVYSFRRTLAELYVVEGL